MDATNAHVTRGIDGPLSHCLQGLKVVVKVVACYPWDSNRWVVVGTTINTQKLHFLVYLSLFVNSTLFSVVKCAFLVCT